LFIYFLNHLKNDSTLEVQTIKYKSMKLIKLITFSAILLVSCNLFAQKTKVTSGSLAALKGVEQIKMVYDFSNLAVGDFKSEDGRKGKR
jgi:hypothetical protein